MNQYFPVENKESALSNLKALKTNDEWLIEQANKAMQEAEFEFEVEKDDDDDENGLDLNDLSNSLVSRKGYIQVLDKQVKFLKIT